MRTTDLNVIPPFRTTRLVRRTADATAFNVIANHPMVRPWIGGDGAADLTAVVAEPSNIALLGEAGGFVCMNHGAGRYEVHSLFDPSRSGQAAIHAMRDAMAYMFTSTPCVELLTKVPVDNLAAKGLARLAGFTPQFESLSAWNAESQKLTAFYSLPVEKWALLSRESKRMGAWFHAMLDTIRTDEQHTAHPDDAVHDAMVGATIGMLQAGLVWKAVTYYNRWALWTGYETLVVESECPLVVSFDQLRIEIMQSHVEVLSCQ